MDKDSKCTCRTIVVLIKPFVWRRSRCRRRRDLLKLPSKDIRAVDRSCDWLIVNLSVVKTGDVIATI